MRLAIVSATRLSQQDFWHQAALGQSLQRLSFDKRIRSFITFSNQQGLPFVYNHCISLADPDEMLFFVHDDVWIVEIGLCEQLYAGLQRFDVIGIAGNKRRLPGQPGWCFLDTRFTWDDMNNLSGMVAHGDDPFGMVNFYGSVPAECELLDGVMLAVHRSTLLAAPIAFDPLFDFHFYDLDFCRQARQAGLKLGTWPISITHQSIGIFGQDSWHASLRNYLSKWGELEQLASADLRRLSA